MIKLGVVIGTLQIGGTELQLLQLLENIDRRLFEPLVFALTTKGPLADRIADKGIRVISLNVSKHSILCALARFWKTLSAEKPDILYCLLFESVVLGSIAGRLAGVKRIVGGIRGLGMSWTSMRKWQMRAVQGLVDSFIVNSEAIKNAHGPREWIDPGKIAVIPNGLDLSAFPFTEEKSDVIGIVGSLKAIKGQEQFLMAASILAKRGCDYRFVVVGDGPDKDRLVGFCGTLGLLDRVLFTGNVTNVPDYLKTFKILVSASAYEGFSNALLEAMSAGTPVVASNVPSNNELVVDGQEGLLYKYNDPEDLARKILYLIDNAELYRAIQRKARLKVECYFAVEKMVHATQEHFVKLLST